MKTILAAALILAWSFAAFAQTPAPPGKTSPDEHISSRSAKEAQALDEAIKPYVAEAKKTYPDAKERFLKGLPPKHGFYVATRLKDSKDRVEQVFVKVERIDDGFIAGKIASPIRGVEGFKRGDSYRFPETDLIDWLILRPDGTEEGNVVGKFLDTYRKTMQEKKEPAKQGAKQ